MSFDQEEATDEILALVREAWTEHADHAVGYVPYLVWPNKREEKDKTTDGNKKAWGRVLVRHIPNGGKQSLGQKGCRRFERSGLLTMQVMTPVAQRGLTLSQRLGKVLLNAVEGEQTPGGVWFRNVTFRGVGEDAHWYNSLFTAEFVYDVVK